MADQGVIVIGKPREEEAEEALGIQGRKKQRKAAAKQASNLSSASFDAAVLAELPECTLDQLQSSQWQAGPPGADELAAIRHKTDPEDQFEQHLHSFQQHLLVKIQEMLNQSFARQSEEFERNWQDHLQYTRKQTVEGQSQSAPSPPKPIKTEDGEDIQKRHVDMSAVGLILDNAADPAVSKEAPSNLQARHQCKATQTVDGQSQTGCSPHKPIKIDSADSQTQKLDVGAPAEILDKAADPDVKPMQKVSKITFGKEVHADNYLQRFVKGFPFQSIVMVVVSFQSFYLAWEANERVALQVDRLEKNASTQLALHFRVVDILFIVFFTAEILLRMAAWKLRFFETSDHEFFFWNIFDLALLASTSLQFFDLDSSAFRAVRMFRIARVLRIIRAYPKLRKMIYTLLRSMESMLPLIVMLFLTLYTFSLIFVQGAYYHLQDLSPEELELEKATSWANEKNSWIIIHRFGHVLLAMRSLFASITGGDPWDWLFEPIMRRSWLYSIVALFFVLFFIFAVMNVVTGVFVDEAMKISAIDKDIMIADALAEAGSTFEDIKQFVSSVDTDKDGTLTCRELIQLLKHESVQRWLAGLDIELDEGNVHRVLRVLDPDQTDRIDPSQFCDIMRKLRGGARSVDLILLTYDLEREQKLLRQALQRHTESASKGLLEIDI